LTDEFRWEGDLTEQRIQQIGPTIKRAMVAAAGKTAPQAESWMKTNARWTDRTGNARNGLTARSVISTNSVKVVLSHSVPYGIWLEVRWDGKYAIIEPAIREWAPRMMDLVARLAFTRM
jgi:hypothetical protein